MDYIYHWNDLFNLDSIVDKDLPAPRRTILVVDDNSDTLLLAQRVFGRLDVELVTARTVESALEYLGICTPDVLLTDLMFPEKSGFALLEQLQRTPRLSAVPALVMSSKRTDYFLDRARKLGAAEYMVKPFAPKDLLKRVSAYL